MTAPGERLAQFLAAAEQLPPYYGTTFRGCPADAAFERDGQISVLSGVLSTSRDVDVATEGRTLSRLFAILSRTGRDISAFSARQDDQEVVLLPGSVLVLERTIDVAGFEVRLVSEILPNAEPVRVPDPDLAQFANELELHLSSKAATPARGFEGVTGKFSGDIA